MKKTKTWFMIFAGVCGLLLMLWFILSGLRLTFNYVAIAIPCAVFTVFVIICDRKRIQNYILIYLPCFFLALLYFLVPYSLTLKPAVNVFQQMIIFTTPVVLLTFLVKLNKSNPTYNKFYTFSLAFVVVFILFVYVITMRELSEHPNI